MSAQSLRQAAIEWLDCMKGRVQAAERFERSGRVIEVAGVSVNAIGPPAEVGELCLIHRASDNTIPAQVAGFARGTLVLLPLGRAERIYPGARVTATGHGPRVPVGEGLLGRVIDAMGAALDGGGPPRASGYRSTVAPPPGPLERSRIEEPLHVGVRAIDGLLAIAKGQRVGIFAGSGVGKSSLLGMMARHSNAEVNVIALIGERGREVGEFIHRRLGADLKRSVVVVATSDQPPMLRLQAGLAATAIAEHFRDEGRHVLLMMDSLTRLARAQREIGVAAGEPPASQGYPPSAFALLPELLERAGPGASGTITGLYTVLVERDDMQDVVADIARATLDGHIVLSRELAQANHYPAIDILSSVSRLMRQVAPAEAVRAAASFRDLYATYHDARDLLAVGAYRPGGNATLDRAVALMPAMKAFLRQGSDEEAVPRSTTDRLVALMTDEGSDAASSENPT